MPALSFHFGLQPSEFWALTLGEYDAYLGALAKLREANSG